MSEEIIIERAGPWGIATLNRPAALNALTLGMVRALGAASRAWLDDPHVGAILLKAVPGRAFSAGGDIKAAYAAGLAFRRGESGMNPALYFAEEYLLDLRLQEARKPTVALMDGIVMGGGFGLAGPCRFRVATDNTVFAMPEVGIGFFPDVGSTYFLRDCPGEIGTYLALTGVSIGPGDMMAAGLATHFVPASMIGACEQALRAADADEIADVLARFSARPPGGELVRIREMIDRCFRFDSVRQILTALSLEDIPEAKAISDRLQSRSPTSVVVTLAHLRGGSGLDFASVIARDFALMQHFLQEDDFYEGVHAAVIDRNKSPRWQPESFDLVDAARIARHMGPAALSLDQFSL